MKTVCGTCRSENVQMKVWVNPNTMKVEDFTSENFEEEDNWCEDCQSHVELITIDE